MWIRDEIVYLCEERRTLIPNRDKNSAREACTIVKFQIEQPHAAENREKQGGGTLLLPGRRNDRSRHIQ